MRSFSDISSRFVLSFAAILVGFTTISNAALIVSSSGATGSTALQIPSVVASSPWKMAYDPSTLPADLTATASKGLYTQSAGITAASNMSWANTAGGGIQILLPHTAGSAAVLGLGALNSSATFSPAALDGSGLPISISMSMGARQTSTPNDRGQIAGLLVQGGKYYRTAWTSFAGPSTPAIGSPNISYSGLTASSFGEITITRLGTDGGNTNFSSNPDFSIAGGPIQLGYLSGYDNSLGAVDATNRSVVNQWSVTIVGVPEPTSLAAVGISLSMFKRKRA